MKKKIVSGFLAAIMIVSFLPTMAFAATTIEVNSAKALTDAINSANAGDTIKLTADIT